MTIKMEGVDLFPLLSRILLLNQFFDNFNNKREKFETGMCFELKICKKKIQMLVAY